MEGTLIERGIGFYLTYEEFNDELNEAEKKAMANPGNYFGLGLASIYVVWPLDFIPDMIPMIGMMDDLAVMRFGWTTGGMVYDILDYIL